MKKTCKIGQYTIQEFGNVFIIAEAGVNHNGDLQKALQLVDVAAQAGANAVKFQTFKAEQVVTAVGKMAKYQKRNIGTDEGQAEMLRKFELQEEFYQPIIRECQKKGIIFLSTPHGGRASVDFLESLNIPAYKVGSGDLTNYLLLGRVAETGKPVILSTGMATFREAREAINFLSSKGSREIIVLHCTTDYPCSFKDVNLAAMITMMKRLEVPVGYSDHTLGDQVAIMAATLGAAVYECHFTLDKKLPGPDHKASADPRQLKEKIQAIRNIRTIMGSPQKVPTAKEKREMIPIVRKSIVATHSMKAGHILFETDMEAKRPGNGLSPVYYEQCLGKRLIRDFKSDKQILLEDLR